ncbi:hypothetical protein FHS27_003183 [Rhodopirellula rubra]|uniref:C-type lectin domain-containing protein n=1 Tax=Aporhodopirellula rubra TaxID=980271 RepID=A0A7W5E139_9BACT|nr:dockerin type I domain-containing protein [Aporhodopirellula rubra]MBB3207362.1 hypothetical protein [Aporhodopirellula rubra]
MTSDQAARNQSKRADISKRKRLATRCHRRWRFEQLESRWMLAASIVGEPIATSSVSMPVAEAATLEFESVFDGRDLQIARAGKQQDDGSANRFLIHVDTHTELSLYIDTQEAKPQYSAQLLDMDENRIDFEYDSHPSEVIELFAPKAGDYIIELFGLDSVDYQVRVLQGDLPFEPTRVARTRRTDPGVINSSFAGVITSGLRDEDIDTYSLGIVEGGTEIDVLASIPVDGTVIPIVEVYGPNGILEDEDPARERVRSVATVSGQYEVRVRNEAVTGDSRYTKSDLGTWLEAEQTAQTLGGHLVAINSQEEQSLIESFELETWLGLRLEEHALFDSLQWTSGQDVTYSNWSYNAGSSYGPAKMSHNGQWTLDGRFSYQENWAVLEFPRTEADPVSSLSGADGLYLIDVTLKDTTAPQFASVYGIPTHDLIADTPLAHLAIKFSENVYFNGEPSDAIDLREAGTDGEFFTDDDRVFEVTINSSLWMGPWLAMDVADGPLSNGHYQVSVSDQLVDFFGNPLADGDGFSRAFEVAYDTEKHIFEGFDNDTIATATPIPLTSDTDGTGLFHSTRTGIGSNYTRDDVDYWSFEAPAGSHVSVRFESKPTYTSDLLDADGNVLASGVYAIDATILPDSSRYYLRVQTKFRLHGNAPYQISLDVSPSIQMESHANQWQGNGAVESFRFEQTTNPRVAEITGALSSESGIQYDTFSLGLLNAGSIVSLRSRFPHWSELKPFVELRSDFENVVDLEDSEDSFQGKIVYDAEYYAVIRADRGTGLHGQYVLDIEVEDNVVPQLTSAFALPREGEIGDELISWFGLTFSEAVYLTGDSIELREAGDDKVFDTNDDRSYDVRLASDELSSEFIVAVMNGPLSTGRFRLALSSSVIDQSGNALGGGIPSFYFFEIDAFDSTQLFEGFDNDTSESATALSFERDPSGTSLSRTQRTGVGALETLDDADWWRVEGRAGESVRISLEAKQSDGITFEVRDADQELVDLIENAHWDWDGQLALARFDISRDEEYFIRVASASSPPNPFESQRNYALRVDTVAGHQMERREWSNDSKSNDNSVSFQWTPEGLRRGSIAGTLLSNDKDTVGIGRLGEDLEIRFTIDRPEWSQVESRVFLLESPYNVTELFPEEDGTYRVLTLSESEYYLRITAGALNTGAGLDGQYLLNVEIVDTVPLTVVDVRGIPVDGGETQHLLSEFDITFNRVLNEELAMNLKPLLVEAGADGEFGTGDDQSYLLQHEFGSTRGRTQYDRLHFRLASGVNVLQAGKYQLHLPGSLRSYFGSPLGEGEGYSTAFSIGELPEGYRFETSFNDDPLGAVHLEPESPGSGWLTRGIGSLERDDDVDYWSIDVNAGDWVTVWTPSRSGDLIVEISLSNDTGESLLPNIVYWEFFGRGTFEQFRVFTEGKYYLQVKANMSDFPDDRLYEVWVNMTPNPGGQTIPDDADSRYPFYAATSQGTTAIVSGRFEIGDAGPPPNYINDEYGLNHVPENTVVELDVRSTTWTNVDPYGVIDPLMNPIYNGEVLTGSITDSLLTRLIVRPRSRHDVDPIEAFWNVDYIAELKTIDVIAPSVSLESEEDGTTRIVHVTAVDGDNEYRFGSGVVGMSLFAIEDGALKYLLSSSSAKIDHAMPDVGEALFFAAATDRVGNRSKLQLAGFDLGTVVIDSSIARDRDVTLPSRIVVGAGTHLEWAGHWDVLPPYVEADRTIHQIMTGERVIEFENTNKDQNPVTPHDVDRSGKVSALDALIVINHLNQSTAEPVHGRSEEGYYLDVNGDSRFTPLDALKIINRLWYDDHPLAEPEVLGSGLIASEDATLSRVRSDERTRIEISAPSKIKTAASPVKNFSFVSDRKATVQLDAGHEETTEDAGETSLDPFCVDEVLASTISRSV